ncbi:MAG: hypothetical protein ACI84F_002882, partial [Pseudoalteromonas tetraodonis]
MQKSPALLSRACLYLDSVRYAVECRSAHSGREPHSKCDTTIVPGRPCAGLAFALFCLMYRNTNAV